MKEKRGGMKECEAPAHLAEISEPTHAVYVTKIGKTIRYVAKKSITKRQCFSLTVLLLDTTKDSNLFYK